MSSSINNKKDSNKINFVDLEKEILDFWSRSDIKEKFFEKSKNNQKYFNFYEGPPFATGKPHYGHMLSGFVKDAMARYKVMSGCKVNLRGGWDCHGVPVEYEVQKRHVLKTGADIGALGISQFNDMCREVVLRCVDDWDIAMNRIARWIDHSDPYMTMNPKFMEGVWKIFSVLYEKGLIYKGEKVMPYSSVLETPISNFEATDNYKMINSATIYASAAIDLWNDDTQVIIWTTLAWTCLTNMAIGISKTMPYVRVRRLEDSKKFVVAKFSLDKLFKNKKEYEILDEFYGEKLSGKQYEPFFEEYIKGEDRCSQIFTFISVDFVRDDVGTGLVSLAPSFGEDDYYACKEAGLTNFFCPIDSKCCFNATMGKYAGMNVHDSIGLVIEDIKNKDRLFAKESITHKFPFCPRSDTPIVYRAVNTWFLSVQKIKSDIVANNRMINWHPEVIGAGRFANWLENAKDWAISRNRYWGTTIPVWESDSGKIKVVSSVKMLEELSGVKVEDLHREFVDNIEFEIDEEKYTRCPEVFDCWFESGSVPICQDADRYDLENLLSNATVPADFISEGIDQTRGWFYTLMVISTAIFNKPAFKNVIVTGTILAQDGTKMSKRLRNYPELLEVVNDVGSDAIRIYLLKSPATKAEDVKFKESECAESIKSILAPLYQACKGFLKTYIGMYKYKITGILPSLKSLLSEWILFELSETDRLVNLNMQNCNIQTSVSICEEFLNNLNNWYIRLSRRRFWQEDKAGGEIEILRYILIEFSRIIAPFAPYMSEYVFQMLRIESDVESVHLVDSKTVHVPEQYCVAGELFRNARDIILLGRSARKKARIKLRQPLKSVKIASSKGIKDIIDSFGNIVKQELNVDQIILVENSEVFSDVKLLPKYVVLGPIIGRHMQNLLMKLEENKDEIVDAIENGKDIPLIVEGLDDAVLLNKDNIDLRYSSTGDWELKNGFFLQFDTAVNKSLQERGIAREFVHLISSERKNRNLDYDSIISIKIVTEDEDIKWSIQNNLHQILEDTQCNNLEFVGSSNCKNFVSININDREEIKVIITEI